MSNKLIVVDVEADGPCPGLYSMVCFGACIVEDIPINGKYRTYYGQTAPISSAYIEEALIVSGFTRTQHENFQNPIEAITGFVSWIKKECGQHRPVFISDNPAFDWQFINYYMWLCANENPFGFSARRIGDLYCGYETHLGKNSEWKKLRRTKHDHHPVNDAIGNAEALIDILVKGGFDLGGVVL